MAVFRDNLLNLIDTFTKNSGGHYIHKTQKKGPVIVIKSLILPERDQRDQKIF